MSDKKLKEYYGTQRPSYAGGAGRNHYAGADLGAHTKGSLGTRGADSKFSQRMQFAVPNDYYDLLEDEEELEEDVVVENSRYSLEKTLALNEGVFGDIASDLVGDIGAAAVGAIPGIGMGATGVFIAYNIKQLSDDMSDADAAIDSFGMNPSEETVDRMKEVFDNLGINLIDLMQRTLELFPDAETPAAEIASIATSLGVNLSRMNRLISAGNTLLSKIQSFLTWARSFLSKTGLVSKYKSAASAAAAGQSVSKASALWSKVKVHGVFSPVMKWFAELFDSDLAPEALREEQDLILGAPKKMILLGDLIEDYYVQEEAAALAGVPFVYQHRILKPGADPNSYDAERSIARTDPGARQPVEYSDAYTDSDLLTRALETPPAKWSDWLAYPADSKPDFGFFGESLANRSLEYLIMESDPELLDNQHSEDDLEEFDSGPFGVAEEEEGGQEDEIEEYSGAGAAGGGPALPLGMSTKGTGGKKSGDHGGKSFPYTKDVRDKFYDYSRKTYGGK